MENTLFYKEDDMQKAVDFVLSFLSKKIDEAMVICLEGDLGSGKTTLTKQIIKKFGYEGLVQSPTFVIAKSYPSIDIFEKIVHIDAYRIEDEEELGPIGFSELLKNPKNLILIEWASNIKNKIPQNALWFKLDYKDEGRVIEKYEGER